MTEKLYAVARRRGVARGAPGVPPPLCRPAPKSARKASEIPFSGAPSDRALPDALARAAGKRAYGNRPTAKASRPRKCTSTRARGRERGVPTGPRAFRTRPPSPWRKRDYYDVLGVARDAERRRPQEGLSEARAREPPRPESRRSRGRGALQADLRSLRRAVGPGEARAATTGSATPAWAAWAAVPAPVACPTSGIWAASPTSSTSLFGDVFQGGGRRGRRRAGRGQRGADLRYNLESRRSQQVLVRQRGQSHPHPEDGADVRPATGSGARPGHTSPSRCGNVAVARDRWSSSRASSG